MTDIVCKTEFCSRKFEYSKFSLEEINENIKAMDEFVLMTQLTNEFYFSIVKAIKDSLNIGQSYCVLNFNKYYFSNMPTQNSGWNQSELITDRRLDSPISVTYKWLKWLTNKNNKYLKVRDEVVPYLRNPISYRIIKRNYRLSEYKNWGPVYTRCDDNPRDSILIEFRWDKISDNKKKYFISAQEKNTVQCNNHCEHVPDVKVISVKDAEHFLAKVFPNSRIIVNTEL